MLGAARLCCRQGLCDMVSRWFLTLACRWSILPGPAAVKLPGGGPTSHALRAAAGCGLRAPRAWLPSQGAACKSVFESPLLTKLPVWKPEKEKGWV